jgi:hypothetical protein
MSKEKMPPYALRDEFSEYYWKYHGFYSTN